MKVECASLLNSAFSDRKWQLETSHEGYIHPTETGKHKACFSGEPSTPLETNTPLETAKRWQDNEARNWPLNIYLLWILLTKLWEKKLTSVLNTYKLGLRKLNNFSTGKWHRDLSTDL